MGAIFFVVHNMLNPPINIKTSQNFLNMKNRGPDDTSYFTETTLDINNYLYNKKVTYALNKKELAEYRQFKFMYGYHRLSINDSSYNGSQPFEDPIVSKTMQYRDLRERPNRKLICNGEIYNYQQLKESNNFSDHDLQSTCDVEIILPMYIKYGIEETLQKLNGDFSFVLSENTRTFDLKTINIFIARDKLGVKPLYMIKYKGDEIFYMFVSELKGISNEILNNNMYQIIEVPPGTYWSFNNSITNKNKIEFIRYYNILQYSDISKCIYTKATPDTLNIIYDTLRNLLTESVLQRIDLIEENHIGIMLSGSFDSCLLLSIILKINPDITINVFTIGSDSDNDTLNAKKSIDYFEKLYNISISHHIIDIHDSSLIENEIPSVIYNIETYDPTMIKQSLIMSFLLKYIKNKTNTKVLLVGDGLNELFLEGPLNEPDVFQKKSISLLENMYKFKLSRNDKLAGSFGLEIRHPFLDIKLVEYILQIHPILKTPQKYAYNGISIEKYIIRKSFENYLPYEILWRQKQTAYSSVDTNLTTITKDISFNSRSNNYLILKNTLPKTNEEIHYRNIYDSLFPNTSRLLNNFWSNISTFN